MLPDGCRWLPVVDSYARPTEADSATAGRMGEHQGECRLTRPCTHKSRLVSSGWSLSALPPKADIRQRIEHVCFVPLADIGLCKCRQGMY
jgi:hypothetical protein